MYGLEIINLRNDYILKGINLKVRKGELFVVLGPNGAGKTTLLSAIAGLIKYQGSIVIDNISVDNLPPEKRCVSIVFQSPSLFPHMTVFENIAYGLKVKKVNPTVIKRRVTSILDLLKISQLKDRYPKTLSGGEKQRVAIARALITNPKVLLMDEPFNHLDPRLRKYMRDEFKRIQKEVNVTTIFVTHDMKDAKELGNRICILRNGLIKQVGTWEEIVSSPLDADVSEFVGSPNIFKCERYELLDFGLAKAYCGSLELVVPYDDKPIKKVLVYPENIYVYPTKPTGVRVNIFQGTVLDYSKMEGNKVNVYFDISGYKVVAEISEDLFLDLQVSPGKKYFLKFILRGIQVI